MQIEGSDNSGNTALRPHGLFWRFCLIAAWLATLALAAVAAFRVFYHDGMYTLTCLNAFTRYLYLPVYVCLGWAFWQRRWALAVVGAAVAACHLTWIAPEFVRDRRFDVGGNPGAAAASDPPTVRIFFANVAAYNEFPEAFLDEIPAADPDVIVFVEYLPWWRAAARNSPVLKAYPFGTPQSVPRGGEIAVYSRIPLENPQQTWATHRPSFAFDIRAGGQPLRIFCLHSPRPIPWPMNLPQHDYRGYWEIIVPELLALSDPAVVVGDFNATPHSWVYRTLTAGILRSAHEDRGRGYATTWPNGQLLVPPIRIDHALLTRGVECVRIEEGLGIGSDHKPLILDVRLRPVAADPASAEANSR